MIVLIRQNFTDSQEYVSKYTYNNYFVEKIQISSSSYLGKDARGLRFVEWAVRQKIF